MSRSTSRTEWAWATVAALGLASHALAQPQTPKQDPGAAPNVSRPLRPWPGPALGESTPQLASSAFARWSPPGRYVVKVERSWGQGPRAVDTNIVSVYSKQQSEKPSHVSCCQGNRCVNGDVTDVAVSADERRLVLGGSLTCVYSLPDLRKLAEHAEGAVRSSGKGIAMSPLGSLLARAAGSEIELLDLTKSGKLSIDPARVRWNIHLLEGVQVAFHPGGWEVASGGERTKASRGTGGAPPPAHEPITLLNVDNGKLVNVLRGNGAAITRLAYSPTGKHLVSLDQSGGLLFFSVRKDPAAQVANDAADFAFVSDETLVVGTRSGEVFTFNTTNVSRTKLFDLGEQLANVAAAANGTLAIQGKSGRIVLRSASGAQLERKVSGALRGGIAFSADGTLAVLPETGGPQWLAPPSGS